ncbi:MAG: hypothetical protein V3V09_07875 [Arenicellales bacterium]
MTAASVGAATVSFGGIALAANKFAGPVDSTSSAVQGAQDQLVLEVSHSWAADDIKVEIKNQSSTVTTVTEIAPSKISTHLGDVDFDAVMSSGPLRLKPGQVVTLHLDKTNAKAARASQSGQFLKKFQKTFADNVRVVTDHPSFAVVEPVFNPRIV